MFNINPQLREDILQDIPQDWSPTTKAAYIYKRLCSTLQYSTEYFLDEDRVKDYYTNPDNLIYVDGINNNQVVCFTFNAIFGQLLIDANVCSEDMIDADRLLTKNGTFNAVHSSLMFVTNDEHIYDVDSTNGILNRCDLTLTKFGKGAFDGWQSISPTEEEAKADIQALERAKREIFAPEDVLRGLAYSYITAKKDDYAKMSLQDRFDLFMSYLKDTPEYSVESFAFLINLKHTLFTKQEVGQMGLVRNFELSFVKDADTKELKAMILYNPEGYIQDKGFENFDSLQIYEFSVQNRTVTSGVDRQELADKIATRQYVEPKNNPSNINMIIPRQATIVAVPPDGEQLEYDANQQPINVDHYERTEKLTGKKYVCDSEGNALHNDQTPTE